MIHALLEVYSEDLIISSSQTTAIYQKRWKVEEFYKSVNSNASFAKSPAGTMRTQRKPPAGQKAHNAQSRFLAL